VGPRCDVLEQRLEPFHYGFSLSSSRSQRRTSNRNCALTRTFGAVRTAWTHVVRPTAALGGWRVRVHYRVTLSASASDSD
jgi:hypothetical protein